MTRRVGAMGVAAPDWVSDAACKGMDASLFFPERGEGVSQIRAVCRTCPVAQRCLDYALENNEKHGVWGGTSERRRRVLRRELREEQKRAAEVAA